MLTADAIDAVVFDMGGVFVVPDPRPIGIALDDAGVPHQLDSESAVRGHYEGVRGLTDRLAHGAVVETDRTVWSHYDERYFAAVGVTAGHLDRATGARAAIRAGGEDVWTHILHANVSAFGRIARRRPVAVVTNNNGFAAQQCLDHGICQLGPGQLPEVAAIVDSGVIGIAKPDPAIFTPALEALGTDPARTLYVGDTVHADVLGARAAGMAALQLDPFSLHDDHEHWRLPDVAALAAVLGA